MRSHPAYLLLFSLSALFILSACGYESDKGQAAIISELTVKIDKLEQENALLKNKIAELESKQENKISLKDRFAKIRDAAKETAGDLMVKYNQSKEMSQLTEQFLTLREQLAEYAEANNLTPEQLKERAAILDTLKTYATSLNERTSGYMDQINDLMKENQSTEEIDPEFAPE